MNKFQEGEKVKFVGYKSTWSPPKGAIGKVIRVDNEDNMYFCDFGDFFIPTINAKIDKLFWYNEEALEKLDGSPIDCLKAYMNFFWEYAGSDVN